jgi:shikimate dehydrogenase/3-dehydroquinate dehydratase type I
MSVCVSLFGDDEDTLVARLQDLAGRRKIAELRLDRIGDQVSLERLAEARGGLRIVLACVPIDQGGTFCGDEAAWKQIIQHAASHFGERCLVDVPPGFSRPAELAPTVRLVWSWHEAQGCVDTDLETVYQELVARAGESDYLKIVAWAEHHQDSLRAVRLMHQHNGRLLAFAQGPGGRASRVWARALGAPWTYASWRGESTAPGQWAEHELPEISEGMQLSLYGVLGDPIEHSRSPVLWMTAFRSQQVLAELRGQPPQALPSYLRLQHADLAGFREDYASSRFRAFSVTAPLKQAALDRADEASPGARQAGAANFLQRTESGGWSAALTDGAGALDPLLEAGLPAQAPILIVGAGGAARAVIVTALQRGHPVCVAARRPEAARDLVDELRAQGCTGDLSPARLSDPALLQVARRGNVELGVVQATPLGSVDRPGDPLVDHALDAACWVLDMIYHPPETPLLARAREAGARTVRGHRMLLAQMLEQFRLATGDEAPAEALRLALEADLGLPSPPIFLCGPRASGKTTLGSLLARVLDWPFLDADAELERRHQRKIADWLPNDPEGFRSAELTLLHELAIRPARVIALGGGIVETPAALATLAAHPRVLGLALEPGEQLARRLAADDRPALTELPLQEEIELLHQRRLPLYEKACSGRWLSVGGMRADSFHRLLQRLKLLL